MTSPLSLRAQLAAVASNLHLLREADPAAPLRVTFARGGVKVRFEFLPGEIGAETPTDLSAIERAVLKAATKTPQTVKALARAAKHCYGRTSEAVSRLTSLDPPLLIKVRGGVRLP